MSQGSNDSRAGIPAALHVLEDMGNRLLDLERRVNHPAWQKELLPAFPELLYDPVDRLNQVLSSAYIQVKHPDPSQSALEEAKASAGRVDSLAARDKLRAPFAMGRTLPRHFPGTQTSVVPKQESDSTLQRDQPVSARVVVPQPLVFPPDEQTARRAPGRLPAESFMGINHEIESQRALEQDKDGLNATVHRIRPPTETRPEGFLRSQSRPIELNDSSSPRLDGHGPASVSGVRLTSEPARLLSMLQTSAARVVPSQAVSTLIARNLMDMEDEPDKSSLLSDASLTVPVEQLVEKQFEKMLERLELAYLRTYGTSGR
jgi:hypothetical protein